MNAPSTQQSTLGSLSVGAFHQEDKLGKAKDWSLFKRLVPYMRPHGKLLAVALLLMPITSLTGVLQPLLLKMAIDAALVERSADALATVVALFATAISVEFVARFGQIYFMQLSGQRAMADLRRSVFKKIQGLRVGYFDHTPTGRIVTRVTNDIDAMGEFFASGAVTAVADLMTLAGIVGFMLYLDWQLSLVAFLALPPLATIVAVFRRYARDAYRDIRAKIAQLNAFLAEQVQGVAIIQAFGREERCAAEYDQINRAYRDANYRSIRYDALLYSVVESISVASVAIILFYASTRSGLTDPVAAAAYVGTVVAFYEYIQRFFVPIRDLSTKYTIIQSSLASAERIFGLMDTDEPDAPQRKVPEGGESQDETENAAVEFRDVTFAYREGQPVVEGIDLRIRPGQTVALVGATGSGKTTLTSLLLRLYELSVGSIFVDGIDIQTLDRHDLRSRFAMVPQDVFLFRGTVLDNVAVGVADPDEARAREALESVGAWSLISAREGGLRAEVEERGSNFSAGERQLLAFARALYRDPPILILDEATANIDSETEARIQEAVLKLVEGRTAIVIAHRLSTVRNADRILVMHRGRIVEDGTHGELLAAQGVYARLHALHFG